MGIPREFTDERPMRVLFLGQINLRKGAHHLIEAARRIANLPVEFDFVGPVEIALPADLPGNVRFHGTVSRDETAKFYGAADAFILPTLSDGFALTQLEAQARGLPVIATGNCGRVVEDERNGWMLRDATAASIAGLLTRLAASPGEVARCQAGAGVSETFSMKSLGASLESIEQALE